MSETEADNESKEAGSAADSEDETAYNNEGLDDATFKELVRKGYTYREDYDFEMFGQTRTLQIQPLTDEVYQPLLDRMEQDLGEEKFERLLKMKRDGEVEDEEDIEELANNEEFGMDLAIGQIGALRIAAKYGVDYSDLEGIDSREEFSTLVDQMVNQKSILLGMEVMNVTGAVGELDDFPGARGR